MLIKLYTFTYIIHVSDSVLEIREYNTKYLLWHLLFMFWLLWQSMVSYANFRSAQHKLADITDNINSSAGRS